MTIPKALVTGCAGFIGSHLCRSLTADGWDVVGIDDYSIGRRVLTDGTMVYIKDVRDAALLRQIAQGCDVIYHLAVRNIIVSAEDVADSWSVNCEGTNAVYAAALSMDPQPLVVFTSSVSVYGQADELPTTEDAPFRCSNPYTAAKIAAELYGASLVSLRSLPLVVVRPSNVYGPGHLLGPANIFLEAYRRGDPAVIQGTGQQTRDYTYIDDIVAGIRAAASREHVGRVFNLGTRRETSLLQLASLCADAVGAKEASVTFAPLRRYDMVHHRAIDSGRAERVLGWRPQVTLEEGLRRTACFSAANML